jgi:hypothetical protein
MRIKIYFQVVTIFVATFMYSGYMFSQKNDYFWHKGFFLADKSNPIVGTDTLVYGATTFDFNTDPVKIYRDKNRYTIFLSSNASYSTDEGKAFSYSNGANIYQADDEVMMGGDSINYGRYWELFNYKPFGADSTAFHLGFHVPQIGLYLKDPGDANRVYYLNQFINFDPNRIYNTASALYANIIDTRANNNQGKVITKDLQITDTIISSCHVQAVRHANGRDWWITLLGYGADKLYTIYLGPEGFGNVNTFDLGVNFNWESSGNSIGQSAFSNNGDQFVILIRENNIIETPFYINAFDFDRCTGAFSRHRKTEIPHVDFYIFLQGIGISPNGYYAYTGDGLDLYQYDLRSEDLELKKKKIATYDGFRSVFGSTTQFHRWIEGPDGRLYGTGQSGSCSHMHLINYPDEEGDECGIVQHAIKLPTSCDNGLPNFPNYRLGPLDGSSCDTLGLDNHPIAKYRYEPDTIDYKRIRFTDLSYFRPETWSWDFGDNSPKISQRSPYHTYAQNGTYKVCLTVNNENSSNTSCRNITIGTSATEDDLSMIADVTLFPNPVQDNLLITIGDYIPERGYIEIYNLSGQQIHKQRAYYGHNNVDMSAMVRGTYVLRVVESGSPFRELEGSAASNFVIKEEKVVKI